MPGRVSPSLISGIVVTRSSVSSIDRLRMDYWLTISDKRQMNSDNSDSTA